MQQHHGSQKAAAIGGGPTTPGLLLPRGPRGSPTPLQRGSGSGRGTPTTTGTHTPAASDLDTDTESGTQSDADFAAAGLASSSSTPRHQRAASGEFYVAPGEDLSELLRRTAVSGFDGTCFALMTHASPNALPPSPPPLPPTTHSSRRRLAASPAEGARWTAAGASAVGLGVRWAVLAA